jgi:uncharacterized protein YhaN
MTIFLLIAIIVSLGGAALVTVIVGADMPLYFADADGNTFLGTAAFWAACALTLFMVIAVLISLSKKKAKPIDMDGVHKKLDYLGQSVKETLACCDDSEMKALLAEMKEMNETVPLLKRLHQESEDARAQLKLELDKKDEEIMGLQNENEQLEKSNRALQRVVDNALEPYRDKDD